MNHPTLAHIYRVDTMKGTCALLILREQVPASELDKCKCKTAGKKLQVFSQNREKSRKKQTKFLAYFSLILSFSSL